MNTNEIRFKLQNGASIESICKEYQLTFNELYKLLQHEPVHEPLVVSPSGRELITQIRS